MGVHEKNGMIIVKLNYAGVRYLRTFFNKAAYNNWINTMIEGEL